MSANITSHHGRLVRGSHRLNCLAADLEARRAGFAYAEQYAAALSPPLRPPCGARPHRRPEWPSTVCAYLVAGILLFALLFHCLEH